MGVLTIPLHFLIVDDPWLAALKTLLAGIAVLITPGGLLLLAAGQATGRSLVQVLALSIPGSLAAINLCAVATLVFHVPAATVALACFLVISVLTAWRFHRDALAGSIFFSKEDAWICAGLAALGIAMYFKGSPINTGEDLVHVAVIRRLAELSNPAIDNVAYSPNDVYSYPLPSTHFIFALLSLAGGVDPLFAYHKARALLAIAAILMVYVMARLATRNRVIAAATLVAGMLFLANGSFADVPGYSWGQLAPFSHASDVAMGLLLPALLLATFAYFRAGSTAAARFYLAITAGALFMLTLVHIREMVQYVVYVVAFAIAALWPPRDSRLLKRSVTAFLAAAATMIGYTAWDTRVVQYVGGMVDDRKSLLVEHARQMTAASLFQEPFLDRYFSTGFVTTFYLWFPIVILLTPLVLALFNRRRIVFGMCLGIGLYLVIIRVPLVSIPYLYLTYYEMLFTPVRNFVPFAYVLTGLELVIAAVCITRIRRWWLSAVAFLATIALLTGLHAGFEAISERLVKPDDWLPVEDLLFLPVLASFAVILVALARRGGGARFRRALAMPWPRSWPFV
ncbi:MAG: hypothetical protein JOZ39_01540, partial [Chloroflexi bacterium]|nr:hypothetical protein [Chloroflexota bacterium]